MSRRSSIEEGIPLNIILSGVAKLEALPDAAKKQMIAELPSWIKARPILPKDKFSGFNLFQIIAMHDIDQCVPIIAAAKDALSTINEFSENKCREEEFRKDEELLTPLMIAVICGHKRTAFELIKNGADLWQKNMFERSPLFFAQDREFRNDLRKVAYEYAPKKTGLFSVPPKAPQRLTLQDLKEFVEIVDSKKGNIFKTISRKGFGLDGGFFFRLMDLVEFAPEQKDNIVKVITNILRDNFPCHFQIGAEGKSNNLYHYAAEYNIVELADVIRHAEMKSFNLRKVNHLNGEGFTPLIIAVQNQNVKMAEALVFQGADLSVKGSDGKSALDVARESKNQEMIDFLSKLPAAQSVGGATAKGAVNPVVRRTTLV